MQIFNNGFTDYDIGTMDLEINFSLSREELLGLVTIVIPLLVSLMTRT